MAQLTCQNLCVGYDGQSVLQDLSFELLAGDYLCIVGENGSGKSTLMKTILGLQAPISGRILTGDELRKNEIGYLPQQTVVQKDFPASVREIVLSGCQGRCGSRPFYNKEEKQLAAEAMEKKDYFVRSCIYNKVCVVGKKEVIYQLVEELQLMQYNIAEILKQFEEQEILLSDEGLEQMKNDCLDMLKAIIWMLDGAKYLWQGTEKSPDSGNC